MGTLACKFIKKSLQLADTVAFILPQTFEYIDSPKRKIDKNIHIVNTMQILNNSFISKRKNNIYNCKFIVYKRKDFERITSTEITDHFKILKANDKNGDIFIQYSICFGSINKRIIVKDFNKIEIFNKKSNCQRFVSIKCNKNIDEVYKILQSQQFKKQVINLNFSHWCVITNQILIKAYNKCIKNQK